MTPLQVRIESIRSVRYADYARTRNGIESTLKQLHDMLVGFDHCRRGDIIDILHRGEEFTIEVKPGPAGIWMYRNGQLVFGGVNWNNLEESLAELLA